MTNDKGIARIDDLPLGRYYLVETKTIDGFVLDDTPIEADLSYIDQNTKVVFAGMDVTNERQKVQITVTKTDSETKEALEGAVFGLFAKEDIVNKDGKVIVKADADFGKNPHGIQGGIRPGIIISCDASNHDGAPQVSVVPLSSKLKDIPVHVILNPKDVSGFGLSKISDFMPEDAQTISKGCIRAKSGTVIEDSGVREEIDRALIRQFDLLPVARKMVMEELANGQQN